MILLDTHVLIWFLEKSASIGRQAQAELRRAFGQDGVAVSAISYWEIGLLVRKNRLQISKTPEDFRNTAERVGIREIPLDGEAALRAAGLELHPDPADRFILATALVQGAPLMTADERLLAWSGEVPRLDARA